MSALSPPHKGRSASLDRPSPSESSSGRPSPSGSSTVYRKIDAEAGGYGATSPSGKQLRRRGTYQMGESLFPSRYSTWTVEKDEESMDDAAIVVNLLADLSPAGVLPLSFGMIGTGYIPSLVLLVIFASAAAYMMYLVARTFEATRTRSYDKMWAEVVGEGTAWVPILTVLSVCFGCCLAYACMFGDLFAGCMPSFGITFATRPVCITALGVFPLLPLCMLKDLSLLAPTSLLALLSVLYTIAMMVIRYFDSSYAIGGRFLDRSQTMPPSVGDHTMTMGASSLLLVNALAVAFLCHYNGCKYYREFIGHPRTPGKFSSRVNIAFGIVSSMFALAMIFGRATFGPLASAVILNNYAANDLLANIARVCMGLANVLSFPLMFSGLREQALALIVFVRPSWQSVTELVMFQNAFSTIALFLIIFVAVLVEDAGLVIGLVGSICGAATIYVIPCFLFDRAFSQKAVLEGERLYSRSEKALVRTIGSVGVFLMFAGAAATFAF